MKAISVGLWAILAMLFFITGCGAPGRFVAQPTATTRVIMYNGDPVAYGVQHGMKVDVRFGEDPIDGKYVVRVIYENQSMRSVTVYPEQIGFRIGMDENLHTVRTIPKAEMMRSLDKRAGWALAGSVASSLNSIVASDEDREEADTLAVRDRQEMDARYAELDRARNDLAGTTTLAPNQIYGGLVAFKPKRFNHVEMTVPVEQDTFLFDYRWRKYGE